MNKKQPLSKQTWITDPNVVFLLSKNKKYNLVKTNFFNALQQQAKQGKIGYYDFLLVAKKLAFRFQQSSHLMALKNYFTKNKNLITCKKLSDCLSISQESLTSLNEQKIIVKFNVPDIHFAPIKQETQQDEDFQQEGSSARGPRNQDEDEYHQEGPFQQIGKQQLEEQTQRQLMEKMAIILSIKVEQMQKKLFILTHGQQSMSLLTYFDHFQDEQINYEQFKRGVIDIVSAQKEKVKLSQDDVKTIFHLLDDQKAGYITSQELSKLKNLEQSGLLQKMKEFYKSRLNKQMVKNTLFKLGKVKNNSIQIYQLKNASLMEFKQIQESIVNHNDNSSKQKLNLRLNKQTKEKSRIPHFGPLKGAAKWKYQQNNNNNSTAQKSYSQPHYNFTYASTHPINPTTNLFSINKERQKIQKILKQYKDPTKTLNRSQKNGQTVASKLRSLFIHKVILPRQKMLQEEKDKFFKSKMQQHQLSIKPLK